MVDATQPIYDQNWLNETDKLTDKSNKMKRQVTKFATVETENSRDFHRVDTQGNYFVNGKCVNPKATTEGNEIGYNIPDLDWKEFDTNIAENIWNSKEN